MHVVKHGFVRIEKGNIAVEDWLIQRDSTDPADETNEQLVLQYAAKWALKILQDAVTQAALNVLRTRQSQDN
jgi:hypothetical protein